ncbi:hypothetical protein BH23VER1_BH23VER1_20580 [soil metagenome]
MDSRIRNRMEGARAAEGTAVIIDVFRAFTFACYAIGRGCSRIFPVADPREAYAAKQADPDLLLAGERFTKMLPGFDFGNSPAEIESVDLAGRALVHCTHAGTRGLVAAERAGLVLTGSFANATAIARLVRERGDQTVSLVCMGHQAERPTDEDTLCAEFLRALITGEPPDPAADGIAARLRQSESAAKFFDPAQPWTPERDFELCVKADVFNFVLVRRRDREGRLVLEKA